MHAPSMKLLVTVVGGLALVVTAFAIGHWTTPSRTSSTDRLDAYFTGLLAGQVEGRREGRALQAGKELPADARKPVRAAFNDGYVAGGNDAFAGYDGGWTMGVPYVVIFEPGNGQIVYHIKTRVPFESGQVYYLCANGHTLCHRSR